MISLKKHLNVRKHKHKNKDIDILESITKLQNSVLRKACILNGVVKDCSIGPLSNCSDLDEYFDTSLGSFVTSTPDDSLIENGELNGDCNDSVVASVIVPENITSEKSKISNNKPKKSKDHETLQISTNMESLFPNLQQSSTQNSTMNAFETSVRIKMEAQFTERIKKIVEKNNEIAYNINGIKQELHLARTQKEIERTQWLLQEEEEMAKETERLSMLYEQQYTQGLDEANERVRQTLLKQQEFEDQQKEELREVKERLDKIHQYQIMYRNLYQQLQKTTQTCKNGKEMYTALFNETTNLRLVNERFDVFLHNTKQGQISSQDIADGEKIIEDMKRILESFKKEADAVNLKHANAEKADALKKEEQAKKELEEQTQLVSAQENLDGVSSESDIYVQQESYERHLKLKTFLEEYEASLEPLLKDDNAKKFRFSCQRAINIPVNAISPDSRAHMQDKFLRLCKLLKGQPILVSNVNISASMHPLGIKFCANLLAKKLVSQGEHTVSSKPEAAFAIAGIIVSLWQELPEFGMLLLAHFQNECPYLIPAFMPQMEGQSNEDYYRLLGYKYIDGKVESQDKFLKRMSGIMRLYAAIIITQPHQNNGSHVLGLKEAWRWLAASLNLEPRLDITATLILDMLEVAGHELMKNYSVQFRKLLYLLCTDVLLRIEKVTPDGCGGPVGRLKTFLEKTLKEDYIAPPIGLLSKQIW